MPSMVALGDSSVGQRSLIPRSPGLMARAQMRLVASDTRTVGRQHRPLSRLCTRHEAGGMWHEGYGGMGRGKAGLPEMGMAICSRTKRMLSLNWSGVMISSWGTAS